jgi:putative membrane protein
MLRRKTPSSILDSNFIKALHWVNKYFILGCYDQFVRVKPNLIKHGENPGKGRMMMGYFGRCGLGGFGMLMGPILFIGLLIGLVFLVVWAVRRMTANQSNPGSPHTAIQSARDTAQLRYAKGEISREEYQQIISDLSS